MDQTTTIELTSWQFDLNAETFDGNTEMIIWLDFSAIYKMPAYFQEKFTHGTTCNQLVAMVLHSPGERPSKDERRPVICDYWRVWSQVKGNASFSQMAIKEICMFYKQGDKDNREGRGTKPIVPNLERVKVKSDGSRYQFKGRKNLGLAAEFPHPPAEVMAMASGGKGFQCLCRSDSTACGLNVEPGISIEYDHDFFASHHGSGAIDSIGKDGPKAMDDSTDFGCTFRYAAGHCYTFCQRNLTAPDPKRLREGIWSATGNYFWRLYSDGTEKPTMGADGKFPVVPETPDFQALEGSNEFYYWSASNESLPEIKAQFLSCYCKESICPNKHITCAHSTDHSPEFFITHRLPSVSRRGAYCDSESEYQER